MLSCESDRSLRVTRPWAVTVRALSFGALPEDVVRANGRPPLVGRHRITGRTVFAYRSPPVRDHRNQRVGRFFAIFEFDSGLLVKRRLQLRRRS